MLTARLLRTVSILLLVALCGYFAFRGGELLWKPVYSALHKVEPEKGGESTHASD